MKCQFVAYYTVSTNNRSRAGLELAVQQEAIEELVSLREGTLIAKYTETETGAEKDRPTLKAALKRCQQSRALLMIGRLDRLCADKHKASCLMQSGVDFIAADSANVRRLTECLFAALTGHEREMISSRTRDALAAAKARGVKLGATGKVRASENKQQADTFAMTAAPVVHRLQNAGVRTLYGLAAHLNSNHFPTARNRKWHAVTVARLLDRIAMLDLSQA